MRDKLDLKEELFLVTGALAEDGVDYALCGGIAVVVHGYPRMTQDIDLLILGEDLGVARETLRRIGFRLESGRIPFDAGRETERHIFGFTKTLASDYLSVDIILVGKFLEDVWAGRRELNLEGHLLNVIDKPGLAKMKRAAGRPKDLDDLQQLGLSDTPP